jgi:hypothetical protein
MLPTQNESLGKPTFAKAMRPRPRIEGTVNPAMEPKQSPYGDGARVVPKKLGLRAAAAKRLQKG